MDVYVTKLRKYLRKDERHKIEITNYHQFFYSQLNNIEKPLEGLDLDVKAIEVCCTRRRGAQGRKENQERKGQQKQI